jgi:DNA-3-methyladenine glycosylase
VVIIIRFDNFLKVVKSHHPIANITFFKLKMQILPKDFYLRTDVVQIAQDLLGKILLTELDGAITFGRISETEAYRAPDDRACHAYGNKRTARTETMFSEGGNAYIYLCYGIHHLFNVVTAPENTAHAVLIRAIQPIEDQELMLLRRKMKKVNPKLSAGPGTLSQALGITTALNGISLLSEESAIRIYDDGFVLDKNLMKVGPRIGVDYAGDCAAWEWRFWM